MGRKTHQNVLYFKYQGKQVNKIYIESRGNKL
jgi:hypothetical protein